MVAAWREGFDTVYAQRRVRLGETRLKRATAALFYRLMRHAGRVELPPDTGDFRLMSRRVVDAVRQLREQHRFMKGVFAWVGFPSCAVPYDRAPRHAGTTKWSYWKLWNFALEGITSFTVMPLKVATYLGVFVALLAVIYAAEVVVKKLLFGNAVPGYPSLMTVVLFLGGVQLVTLGVIGEYLGRVFNETKQRPLYLVEQFAPVRSLPLSRSGSGLGDGVQACGTLHPHLASPASRERGSPSSSLLLLLFTAAARAEPPAERLLVLQRGVASPAGSAFRAAPIRRRCGPI